MQKKAYCMKCGGFKFATYLKKDKGYTCNQCNTIHKIIVDKNDVCINLLVPIERKR